jgi:hypothetical protein
MNAQREHFRVPPLTNIVKTLRAHSSARNVICRAMDAQAPVTVNVLNAKEVFRKTMPTNVSTSTNVSMTKIFAVTKSASILSGPMNAKVN